MGRSIRLRDFRVCDIHLPGFRQRGDISRLASTVVEVAVFVHEGAETAKLNYWQFYCFDLYTIPMTPPPPTQLLYVISRSQRSATPVIDDLTLKMTAALQVATPGLWSYGLGATTSPMLCVFITWPGTGMKCRKKTWRLWLVCLRARYNQRRGSCSRAAVIPT